MSDFQGVQFVDGRLPYNLGHAAFEFIESRWGKEGLRQFLFALRKNVIGGGESAYEEAFRLKAEEFDEQFEKYLKDRFKPFRDKERPADYGRDLAPKRDKTPYVAVISIEPSPSGDLMAVMAGKGGPLARLARARRRSGAGTCPGRRPLAAPRAAPRRPRGSPRACTSTRRAGPAASRRSSAAVVQRRALGLADDRAVPVQAQRPQVGELLRPRTPAARARRRGPRRARGSARPGCGRRARPAARCAGCPRAGCRWGWARSGRRRPRPSHGSLSRPMADTGEPTPEEAPRCPPCRGTGAIVSRLGGSPSTIVCPWCEGTGHVLPGHDAQQPHAGDRRRRRGSRPRPDAAQRLAAAGAAPPPARARAAAATRRAQSCAGRSSSAPAGGGDEQRGRRARPPARPSRRRGAGRARAATAAAGRATGRRRRTTARPARAAARAGAAAPARR